ncbi:MAG: 4'-phosphopantetheinyl transferase superfamily protein [Oscillospiraceae bacterium]|nr:4'-phosphopantetheinyl transferase superfamily protein [Oscillospiraceae bacterium]
MKIDFASCIVTGGNFMRQRVESAMDFYSAECVDYFQMILSKRKEAFCDSACGFLLLDGLLQKNKINRSELVITVDKRNRPHFSADNLDFSISHSEGCALCALAIGNGTEDIRIGCDVQRERDYSKEKMIELSRAFMNEKELSDFEKSGFNPDRFFTAWTHRESYVKRAGSDIFDALKSADLSGEYFLDGVIYVCGEKYRYSINRPQLTEEELAEIEENR